MTGLGGEVVPDPRYAAYGSLERFFTGRTSAVVIEVGRSKCPGRAFSCPGEDALPCFPLPPNKKRQTLSLLASVDGQNQPPP